VELFRWLLRDDPAVRYSAAQALTHQFIAERIRVPKENVNKLKSASKSTGIVALMMNKHTTSAAIIDKENCNPNMVQ